MVRGRHLRLRQQARAPRGPPSGHLLPAERGAPDCVYGEGEGEDVGAGCRAACGADRQPGGPWARPPPSSVLGGVTARSSPWLAGLSIRPQLSQMRGQGTAGRRVTWRGPESLCAGMSTAPPQGLGLNSLLSPRPLPLPAEWPRPGPAPGSRARPPLHRPPGCPGAGPLRVPAEPPSPSRGQPRGAPPPQHPKLSPATIHPLATAQERSRRQGHPALLGGGLAQLSGRRGEERLHTGQAGGRRRRPSLQRPVVRVAALSSLRHPSTQPSWSPCRRVALQLSTGCWHCCGPSPWPWARPQRGPLAACAHSPETCLPLGLWPLPVGCWARTPE